MDKRNAERRWRRHQAPKLGALLCLWAVSLAVPARAFAQGRGGKLMLILVAAPMVIPLLGIFAATFGLRVVRSPVLWWFLCALLGLNSALLGSVLERVSSEVTGVVFLLAQMSLAGSMLFTLPDTVSESKAKIVLRRLASVSAFGIVPGLLANLFFR